MPAGGGAPAGPMQLSERHRMPTEILMPALSPTMEEGKLAKWLIKEGQAVKAGDVIAEIETDKATMEVEAVDEGKVGKLLVAEGTEGVKVNTPIAVLLAEGEGAGAAPAPKAQPSPPTPPRAEPTAPAAAGKIAADGTAAQSAAAAAPPPAAARPKAPQPAPPAGHNGGGRTFASPLARRLAREAGLDLAGLTGSGPHGRIIKSDVEAAARNGA